MKNLLPKRIKDSNKGTYGTVLNIAGCSLYTGAAYFSSLAPLKSGAGKVMLASTEKCCNVVAGLAPEVIFYLLEENTDGTISEKAVLPQLENFNIISIGCGLAQNESVLAFFKKTINTIKEKKIPCIIDADGLNLLAKTDIKLNSNFALTPHPKEMSRLLGADTEEILAQPEKYIKECSEKYNSIAVLKKSETLIYEAEKGLYKNTTGCCALAKAGSGDVLTGMISGFAAQGLNLYDACKLGVYLHGLAGELAAKDLSEYSVLASDLLKYIPLAIKKNLQLAFDG